VSQTLPSWVASSIVPEMRYACFDVEADTSGTGEVAVGSGAAPSRVLFAGSAPGDSSPHPIDIGLRVSVSQLRITTELDNETRRPVGLRLHVAWQEPEQVIYTDGRPHPSANAPHKWSGFSTGRWEGPVLIVRTTHLKVGWMRRNGLALSDRATMEERFIRHGDLLTHVYMISDPVYLTEPLVKTNGFRLTTNGVVDPYPCESVDEVIRAKGVVPSHLPGTNHASEEYAAKHHLSVEGVRGGAETALPEFAKRASAAAGSK